MNKRALSYDQLNSMAIFYIYQLIYMVECMTVSHSEPGRFTFTSQGDHEVCGLYLVGRYNKTSLTTFKGRVFLLTGSKTQRDCPAKIQQ